MSRVGWRRWLRKLSRHAEVSLSGRVGPERARRLTRPVFLGTARRTAPVSQDWGFDRGTPVDRHYIEHFLAEHRHDIHGTVLEVQDSVYTRRFGSAVERQEVLDVDPGNSRATVIADLASADTVPSEAFDCFILTQTLQLIFDTAAAIRHTRRILRPGGVLLATVPSVSRVIHGEGLQTDYWRFTVASCRQLFGDVFGSENVQVRSYGNVLANVGFLLGMASEELKARELHVNDPYFPLVIAVRALKREIAAPSPSF